MSILVEVGKTESGYTIFVEDNEVGGKRYWSDSIGGGVVIWDTSLASPEELRFALSVEGELIYTSPVWMYVSWFWFIISCLFFLSYAWDKIGGFINGQGLA